VIEVVQAAIQALSDGKLAGQDLAPEDKIKSRERRKISDYISSPDSGDDGFTAPKLAKFLGMTKQSTGAPQDRFFAALYAARRCTDHDHECCPGRRSCGHCVRGVVCATCNSLLTVAYCRAHPTDPYLQRYAQRRAATEAAPSAA
jgi:hypothetical protein